jgi:hypothetical protein
LPQQEAVLVQLQLEKRARLAQAITIDTNFITTKKERNVAHSDKNNLPELQLRSDLKYNRFRAVNR